MPTGTEGATRATSAMPVAVQEALSAVTAFGVSPAPNASAANKRPRGRLTKREYAGAPTLPFCARASVRSVDLKPGAGAAAGAAAGPRVAVTAGPPGTHARRGP